MKRIFIIDDDSSICKSLQRVLEIGEHTIATYSSAKQFLKEVSLDTDGCLILDVRMPDMNGLELQDYLVTNQSRLKIIFITGYEDLEVCRKAMKAGARDFLLKPVNGHRLFDAIEAVMN